MDFDTLHGILVLALVGLLALMVRERLAHRSTKLKAHILEGEIFPLRKYARILDAEAEIERLNRDAERTRTERDATAEAERSRIISEANAVRASEDQTLRQTKVDQSKILGSARKAADEVIEQATLEARGIAADALDTKASAQKYTAIYDAMRNSVEGYGDEYLIPNHTTIDDLADEFDHKDAGQQLKSGREATRSALRAQKAADCDYVENRRRQTAIHFVVDAFNGKVDSTLLSGKRGNYGKLKQEIEDAFAIVNHHGSAFRNARITDTYKQLRLNELKWVIATEELRKTEREEQRAIKAQIREEERARREYEKAIKQAEKEERMLEKAMEQARKELEAASATERARYEQELVELQEKWQAAEERNRRAISLAQQTKRGHVYIISNIGSFGHDVFKVGMTRRLDPMDRVKELGDASVPFDFDVHAMIYSEDAPRLEGELHRRFEDRRLNKVNLRREFFRVMVTELKQVIDDLGISVHWTMFAEAAQYRESLALAQLPPDQAEGHVA